MATQSGHSLETRIAGKLQGHTHRQLDEAFQRLGFTGPDDPALTKRNRIYAAMDGMTSRQLAVIADKIAVEYHDPDLQEAALAILEADEPPITEITRVDVARCFDDMSLSGERPILEFLRDIWPIDGSPFDVFSTPLAAEIEQAMVRNDDWSVEQLFRKLGALTSSLHRFIATIEAALDPRARRGEEQLRLKKRLDAVLQRDGYRIEESGRISNFPTYRVVRLSAGVAGAPKNLIFASIGLKPEIGFKDAVNNDIVILSNEPSCLVYERPISDAGLLWDELVGWWREANGIGDAEARKSLGERLHQSLQSDAEDGLFRNYFTAFKPVLGAALPALIPQVYLHYDPATVRQLRNGKRLTRQRMDFLMLLPHRTRLVIEVDGSQHFSDPTGGASLEKYAEMVRADRDLRLLGYEVYRFGANELVGKGSAEKVKVFFDRLFRRHGVRA